MTSSSIRNLLLVAVFLFGNVVLAWGAHAQTATPTPEIPLVLPTSDPTGSDIAVVQAQSSARLILLVPFPEDPFWQVVQQTVSERATVDGVTVDVVALSTPSVPEQLAQIDQAITNGYAGILIGAVDATAIAPGIAKANTAGIPVLAIDTAPIGGSIVTVVRTDNMAASKLAAQFIASELDGAGTVLNIQGDLANPVAQERDHGLREGLASFPEISVTSSEGNWQLANGYAATFAQLPQAQEGTPSPPLPLIDAVFAANPDMALGAAQAVEEVKADSVIVVGFGATAATLDGVASGILEAVVAELPQRVGILGVDLMVRHLKGEAVPKTVDSGFTLITRETLDDFRASTT